MHRNELPVRQYWIDVLKSVGIGMIIFFHASGIYFPDTVRYLSAFPIPLFVFLTGFQLSRRVLQSGPREFFERACLRLIIIFLAFGLLTYIPWLAKNLIIPGEEYAKVGPWTPLFGLVYGASGAWELLVHNVSLWFLTFMAAVMLYYYVVFRLVKTPELAVLASLAIFALGCMLVNSLPMRLPWNLDIALVGLPFFAFGYYAKSCRLDQILSRPAVALAAGPVLFVVNYLVIPHPEYMDLNLSRIGNPLLFLIDGITGIMLGMILALHVPRLPLIEIVARNVLVIFGLHTMTEVVFRYGLRALLGPESEAAFQSLATVFAIIAFSCVACTLLAHPIRRYLPWILGRRVRRSAGGTGRPAQTVAN